MVHKVFWKVDLVVCNKEIQDKLVIYTWLIRPTSLLKEAFRHELQKHPMVAINIHQFGC